MEAVALRVGGAAAAFLATLLAPSSPPRPPAPGAFALAWAALLFAALALLSELVRALGPCCVGGRPPRAALRERGRPLAAFAAVDHAFVTANKLLTAAFSFHLVRYCVLGIAAGAAAEEAGAGGGIDFSGASAVPLFAPAPLRWTQLPVAEADVARLLALLALPPPALAPGGGAALGWAAALLSGAYFALCLALLFFVYDCAYAPFHLALHHPSVYALVHKHHHRSAAPHRGNTDAINVHPLEFALGEYNHLAAIRVVSLLLAAAGLPPLHAAAPLAFVVAGGVLASLNHTRLDIAAPLGLFRVAWHDIHHYAYAHNYGQYTMAVDALFLGTFRDVGSAALPGERASAGGGGAASALQAPAATEPQRKNVAQRASSPTAAARAPRARSRGARRRSILVL